MGRAGGRRRAAWRRAIDPARFRLCRGPDIIVLDEPATGLSAREVAHLAEILTHLKAHGVTMIIIEHQTRFLFPLCDRVTVLDAGEVILTGTAEEVRAHPVVRQVYLGE